MNLRFSVLVFLSLMVTATGCSLKTLGVKTTAEILEDGVATFEAESDVELAREAAGSQIKLLETLHRGDPKNLKVLLSLTRAIGSYAFGFLETEAERNPAVRDRAAHLYNRGTHYGLNLLDLRLGVGTSKEALTGSLETWQKRLERAGKRDVPALFWTGYDWASSIRKSANSPAALAELPKAIALIERVLALESDYHYGAPHFFMGVYYADRPRMAGGNPKVALEQFSAGVKASAGKYVMGNYLWARYGAVQTQDAKLFTELLEAVVSSPDDLLPDQRLSQEIARNWARELLKQKSNYFVEE